MVKTEQKGKLVKVKINDIIYIESMGKYIYFHTKEEEKIMALLNITGLEDRLPGDRFLRIHKSFIIAIPFIIMIHGNMIHVEFTKNLIPIGQTYRNVFMGQMIDKIISNKNKDEPDPEQAD